MTTQKFADSHNMVAFLTKFAKSEGFEQIVDFLNANPIMYDLILQALVDGKKIVVTEAFVRRDLQLEDAEVFLDNQLEGMATHDEIYIAPSHNQKSILEYGKGMGGKGKGFSGNVTPLFSTMMVQAQQEHGKGSAIPTDPQHTPTITQPSSSQPQNKHKPKKPKKKDTQIPQSSVPSDNLADEAINEENVSKHSNDLLLNGEDRLKLEELMALCTNLQNKVLDLEHTKTTQVLEIDSLKRRVKKLEKKQRSKTHGLKRLYKIGLSARVVSSEDEGLGEEDASKQGRKIHDIDADEDITLENVHDAEIAATTTTTTTAITDVEMTLAQALAELKSVKPKATTITTTPTLTTTTAATTITAVSIRPRAKGIVFHVQEQAPTPTVSSQQPSQIKVQDKELAFKIQAEEEEEERLAREKAQQIEEANIAWDDVQAKIDADYQLAQRLQA
ncbi:hypothetical protein Tco_0676747 [Tanacetum coccineum]